MSTKRMGETGEQYRARLASEGGELDAAVEDVAAAIDKADDTADDAPDRQAPAHAPVTKGKVKVTAAQKKAGRKK